jgi:hypothetical protein
VGSGERMLVKSLTAGSFFAVKSRSVPGCLADLLAVDHFGGIGRFFVTGARLGGKASGQRQGRHQNDRRETGNPRAGNPRLEARFVAFVQESTSTDGRGETRNSAHKADGYPDFLKYHGSKSTMLSAESVLCVHPENRENLAILKYVIDIIKKY